MQYYKESEQSLGIVNFQTSFSAKVMNIMIKTTILSNHSALQRLFGTPVLHPAPVTKTTPVATQIRCYYAQLRKRAHARSKSIIADMMQHDQKRHKA